MSTLTSQVAALQRLSVSQLQARFAEVYGETTNARNRTWLVRRIAWRLQAVAEGGLSERAKGQASALANDADLRIVPPKDEVPSPEPTPAKPARADDRLPAVGTIITREYKGRALEVKVLKDGFEFDGQVYTSLSAVAKAVTGSHCNGFHFFRLHGGAR